MVLKKILQKLSDLPFQKRKRESEQSALAAYHSDYELSWNGINIATLTGMHIPDQFWKHYKVHILTEDEQLQKRMVEDEEFWLNETFTLTRKFDGLQFSINTEASNILIGLNQADRLRKDGEISFRGL
ncbi:MAG: hypothetical protein JST89_04090 [Cyanobacteria bacterium SZAS-4]|nr:hypothetical protein [Cyanobacteria bacterium SZAS-4]